MKKSLKKRGEDFQGLEPINSQFHPSHLLTPAACIVSILNLHYVFKLYALTDLFHTEQSFVY